MDQDRGARGHELLRQISRSSSTDSSSSVEGDRIGSGRTFGTENGGVITIAVGRSTTAERFQSDWMMTHEMVHLAFPSVAEEHHWIEEGLATYVEPIARAQIGNLTAVKVWSDLVRDLPQGLPQAGDRGLDFTPTWGRTYWGGALFCLLADVEIRRRTGNAKGLQDGMRAVLEAGWQYFGRLGFGADFAHLRSRHRRISDAGFICENAC
jgi:hypothetical protein